MTSTAFLPRMVYSRPSFSGEPVRALTRARSEVMVPEMTLMKEYLPYWSETVLNTKALGTPPGETAYSSLSPLGSMPLRMLPSTGLGRSSTILSISIREPMVDTAEPHSTGKRDSSRTPWRRPWIISA